jgi:hypothetical protein
MNVSTVPHVSAPQCTTPEAKSATSIPRIAPIITGKTDILFRLEIKSPNTVINNDMEITIETISWILLSINFK